jgi:phenylacetate-CoA ligase
MQNTVKRTPVDAWVAGRLEIALDDLTRERLRDWQLDAFRRTVAYAKSRSRFYKRLLDGVDPAEIGCMDDLLALPCSSEKDLAGNEMDFLCVNQKDVSRPVAVPTTGTSGAQKRISFTDKDRLSSMIFIEVGFRTLVMPPATMLILMSGTTEGSIGRTVEKALAPVGIVAQTYGAVGDVGAAYEYLRELRPRTIVGIPNQVAALSRYGRSFGNPEGAHIESVLLSADDVPESLRRSIADLWGCTVFNHYGMTEFGIAGGVECEGFSGYHTRDCDLLFEIVDQDESGIGEIVFTTLDREAMPLIRYRTGDLGRFTTGPCPCGSPLGRIEKVFGRKRNILPLPTGEQAQLSDIGDAVFAEPHVMDYECALTGDGTVEITLAAFPGETPDRAVIMERLKQNAPLGRALGKGMKIAFSCVDRTSFPEDRNGKKTLTIRH